MIIYEYMHPDWGYAFKRISSALKRFAPSNIIWTSNPDAADIHFIHVVGGGDLPYIKDTSKTVMFQHCYHTACASWIDYPSYWEQCKLVVSFHNLPTYTSKKFNFYGMPWGVDGEVFKLIDVGERNKKLFTTGHVADTECIDKLHEACKRINVDMFHTGHNLNLGSSYRYLNFMDDPAFVRMLNSVQYVGAMRLIEGFEMTAVEGLFCGARPIIPECSTYDWYREHAHTINTQQDIVEQIVSVISSSPEPINDEEMNLIRKRFDWKNLVPELFSTINSY